MAPIPRPTWQKTLLIHRIDRESFAGTYVSLTVEVVEIAKMDVERNLDFDRLRELPNTKQIWKV